LILFKKIAGQRGDGLGRAGMPEVEFGCGMGCALKKEQQCSTAEENYG
jgi:hypothetical protein